MIIFQIPEKDFEVQILHTCSSLHELCAVVRLLVLESFTNIARHRQWKSKGKISSNSMSGCALHQQMQNLITSIFRFIVRGVKVSKRNRHLLELELCRE